MMPYRWAFFLAHWRVKMDATSLLDKSLKVCGISTYP